MQNKLLLLKSTFHPKSSPVPPNCFDQTYLPCELYLIKTKSFNPRDVKFAVFWDGSKSHVLPKLPTANIFSLLSIRYPLSYIASNGL